MKKIKNLIVVMLTFAFVLVPTLNATGEKATLDSINFSSGSIQKNSEGIYTLQVNNSVSNILLSFVATSTTGEKNASVVLKDKDGNNVTNPGSGTPLEVGENVFTVEVKDSDAIDNSTTSTYTLKITRKEKIEAKLDDLKVAIGDEEKEINFDVNTSSYEISISDKSSSKIVITAEYAQGLNVTGDGEHTLKMDVSSNTFQVSVKNDNNEEKTYYIHINIKSEFELELEEKLANECPGVDIYTFGIVDRFLEFVKQERLIDGSLIYNIYEITYNEDATVDEIITTLKKKIADKPDRIEIMEQGTGSEDNVSDAILDKIKDSKTVTEIPSNNYNVTWVLDGSKMDANDKSFNLNVKVDEAVDKELKDKVESKFADKEKTLIIDFEHSGNLPKGTKVKVYVEDKFNTGDKVNLYYYNETNGKMELVTKNIVVKGEEGFAKYVEFELEHCSVYALGSVNNNAQTGVLNVTLYIVMSIVSLCGIVFLLKKKYN